MAQKKTIAFTLLLLALVSAIQAQESISTSGGNASGSGGSISYSVGQLVYTTNVGANGSVAQGVQQPYEISIVLGVEAFSDVVLISTVYPNPTTNSLILQVENIEGKLLSFKLFDVDGKFLEYKKIVSKETIISMLQYASATYFLNISDDSKEIKSFKIIKTQ